jgi:hypothetical protein
MLRFAERERYFEATERLGQPERFGPTGSGVDLGTGNQLDVLGPKQIPTNRDRIVRPTKVSPKVGIVD